MQFAFYFYFLFIFILLYFLRVDKSLQQEIFQEDDDTNQSKY